MGSLLKSLVQLALKILLAIFHAAVLAGHVDHPAQFPHILLVSNTISVLSFSDHGYKLSKGCSSMLLPLAPIPNIWKDARGQSPGRLL